ncbi:pigment biosynthesis protein Ayg1 [Amniculicola lignicola CBS 123094]|uniref:Pigment biosynthesis protein Ayg1 n=1 Tax=Amniculicola lignicola CBS 123094 TaxID=1392246 RepID=A0A6A5WBK2_9PLEO|nr:pigment biosynthesis protein Ayg1 [Amniculicola lignicola CBS 123094]
MPNGNWILGDLFMKDYGHKGSIEKLWVQRWKFPCTKAVYPFHDGVFEDFEPVFDHLISKSINDPFSDAYTNAFLPTAQHLVRDATSLSESNPTEAKKLYLRANAVFRLARFPYIGTDLKKQVFEEQKTAYLQGSQLWDVPVEEVVIEHSHAANGDGDKIPVYVRKPKGQGKWPVVLLITGLDGHRPDNTERTEEHLKRGWATVILDIPGTTIDCPANRRDPLSPDRLFSSILAWIKDQSYLDSKKIIAWGLSAGGYYAIRLAHTHKDQILASIGHGAGTHHYIGREWLSQVSKHEYPFGLEEAYVQKYGYASFDELLSKCQREFSLVSGEGEGVAVVGKGMSSSRLLLINGVLDGCMPAEDSLLLAEYGTPKEIRLVKDRLHMGYPEANSIVYPWMEEVMGMDKGKMNGVKGTNGTNGVH